MVAELGDAELAAAGRAAAGAATRTSGWCSGPAACTLGPVAYSVGAMRLLQDRPAEAAASFERAIERSRAMRARPVRGALAGRARRRAAPRCGEDARAAELEAQAAATARELGMMRLQRELALAAPAA